MIGKQRYSVQEMRMRKSINENYGCQFKPQVARKIYKVPDTTDCTQIYTSVDISY